MMECPHSLYFFRSDVDNYFDLSVAANTYKDWHIVPIGRPVIAPPQQKLQQIDIPGANGVLDLSNSLTHYPVFNNRTGTIDFAVLNDVTDWITAYTKILKFLQGNDVKMIMEDDPNYFYKGRFYVDKWNSRNDGTWSEVTLGYDLYPYRLSIKSSIGDWLWDPFNFETDVVQQTAFTDIRIDSVDDEWVEKDFSGMIDMMPVIPEFTVDTDDDQPMEAGVYCSDLQSDWRAITLPEGSNKIYNCILCEATPDSIVKMRFKGHGNVTIDFRSGRL